MEYKDQHPEQKLDDFVKDNYNPIMTEEDSFVPAADGSYTFIPEDVLIMRDKKAIYFSNHYLHHYCNDCHYQTLQVYL